MDKDPNFLNLNIVDRTARTIYLNKSCFNGLYRVNSKGYFNIPSGKKKTVNTFDEINFNAIRDFFKNSISNLKSTDFEKAVSEAKERDFVYFDPPYDIFDGQSNFTSYIKEGFGKDEQIRLAKVFKKLSDRGVYCMLSNHNTEFIRKLYEGFNITVVKAKRMINSKGTGRGFIEEVLITNY